MLRGAKFDKVMEAFFQAQLLGKGRTPEDRTKLLRKLAGIKEPPKVKEEKKKPADNSKTKKKLAGRESPAMPAEKTEGSATGQAFGKSAATGGAKPTAKHELARPKGRESRPGGAGKAKKARVR
jgi:hypothetical protein